MEFEEHELFLLAVGMPSRIITVSLGYGASAGPKTAAGVSVESSVLWPVCTEVSIPRAAHPELSGISQLAVIGRAPTVGSMSLK